MKTITPLAWDTACLLMPDGDFVKTKIKLHDSTLGIFLMVKADVKELIRKYGACRSGPTATEQGFGLMLLTPGLAGDVIFVESRKE